MDVRERLMELVIAAKRCDPEDVCFSGFLVDFLVMHGVTITPTVPGPSEDDHNIMEMCFRNGERHMKEKVGKELSRIAEHMPCITLAQALAMLEGL